MTLDANIIVQGRTPNLINALARGNDAVFRAKQMTHENKLQGLYQTEGQNLLNGDQGALNQLAQFDALQAFKLQSGHQAMPERKAPIAEKYLRGWHFRHCSELMPVWKRLDAK